MNAFTAPNFLPRVLWLDAVVSLGCGILQVLFSSQLVELLQLPAGLITGTGIFFLFYAATVAWVARRFTLPHPVVWLFVVGNFLWAADCALLLVSGWVTPSPLGTAYVIMQALTVAIFAELQWLGMRRHSVVSPA